MKPDNLVREGVVWLKKVFQPWQPGLSRRGNWEDGQIPEKSTFLSEIGFAWENWSLLSLCSQTCCSLYWGLTWLNRGQNLQSHQWWQNPPEREKLWWHAAMIRRLQMGKVQMWFWLHFERDLTPQGKRWTGDDGADGTGVRTVEVDAVTFHYFRGSARCHLVSKYCQHLFTKSFLLIVLD